MKDEDIDNIIFDIEVEEEQASSLMVEPENSDIEEQADIRKTLDETNVTKSFLENQNVIIVQLFHIKFINIKNQRQRFDPLSLIKIRNEIINLFQL